MTEELQDLCFKAEIHGIHIERVTDFAKAQGDDNTKDILEGILKIRNHQKSNGIRVDSSQYLWKKKSEEYVKSIGNRRQKKKEAEERKRHDQEYYATLASGYQPTGETIAEQIANIHDSGELILDWGNSDLSFYEKVTCERAWIAPGLACVEDVVAMAGHDETKRESSQPAAIAELLNAVGG